MANAVALPSGDLLDVSQFLQAIVEAIYPVVTEGLTGMGCVSGKRLLIDPIYGQTLPLPLPIDEVKPKSIFRPLERDEGLQQREMLFEKPTSPDLLANVDGTKKFYLPYELTESDKELLQKLLKDLPALRYPMSDKEIADFEEAFRQHPDRPKWEPELLTEAEIQHRRKRQEHWLHDHRQGIQSAAATGRIVFVDGKHIPVHGQSVGGCFFNTFIPRASALDYLTSIGLSVADESRKSIPAVVVDTAESEPGIFTESGERVLRKAYDERYSDEELKAIDTFLTTPDPATKKIPTHTEAAKRMHVSAGTITRLTQIIATRKSSPLDPLSMHSQAKRIVKK